LKGKLEDELYRLIIGVFLVKMTTSDISTYSTLTSLPACPSCL